MGGALLVGCNGSESPTTSTSSTSSAPSSSSTTSTSPSPSSSSPTTPAYVPVKPTFPAAAKKQTDAGAVAFVEYYLDALDYAWSAPDDKILVGLSTSDCKFCNNVQKTAKKSLIDAVRSSGKVLEAGEISIISKPVGIWLIGCDVKLNQIDYIDASGSVVNQQAPAKLFWAAKVVWHDGWRIQQLGKR